MTSSLSSETTSLWGGNEHKGHLRALKTRELTYKPSIHLVAQEGLLQVHTASFRGSFSGVLSEALRAAGLGKRVMVAQFLKGGVDQGPQKGIHLCNHLEWIRPKIPFCLTEREYAEECTKETINAVKAIWRACKKHLLKGDLDQLVLDEAGLAVHLGYLKESELISTLEKRPGAMDVILTGPAIPSHLMDMADQVTKLRCSF